MIPERFDCADVDGVFCIRFTTTDYTDPKIVVHYWPTIYSTRDVLRYFFEGSHGGEFSDLENMKRLSCKQSRPGEYFVGIRAAYGPTWAAGKHISLLHGSATQPIQTEIREAPTPKLRKGTDCYWSGGKWVKRTKTKTENIDPLSV